MVDKYLEKYKESQRRMQDIAKRQLNIGLLLKDHYLCVTAPQLEFALDKAMNMPLPELDVECETECADKLVESARTFGDSMFKRYSVCDQFGCDNELEAWGAMATVDSKYSRRQFNRRRYERRLQLKRQAVQQAHVRTQQSPDAFQQLLNSASQIYSNIFNNAQTQLTGAVGSLGSGLNGLFGGGP